jgi:aminoglycoside 6'-N-acetyltransferase
MSHVQSAQAAALVRYRFRAMAVADLGLVRHWLEEPHVTRWWPDPERAAGSIAKHLHEPAMQCFILTVDDMDIGYLQAYDPHHQPCLGPDGTVIEHPYRDQPPGTRGIDLFIGDGNYVGRGHGPRLIGGIVARFFDEGSPCVVTDPDTSNAQSIAAFRKAGFRALGERDTPWGHLLLMRCDRPTME